MRTRVVGIDFGSHQALRTPAETDKNILAWAQFRQSETAQGFHMDENVLFAAHHEPVTARTVEPFDLNAFQFAFGLYLNMRARLGLNRVYGGRFIHGKNTNRLQTLFARNRFANDAGAFQRVTNALSDLS